ARAGIPVQQAQNIILLYWALGLLPLTAGAGAAAFDSGVVGSSFGGGMLSLPGTIVPMGASAGAALAGADENVSMLVGLGSGLGTGLLGGVGRNVSTASLERLAFGDLEAGTEGYFAREGSVGAMRYDPALDRSEYVIAREEFKAMRGD